MPSEPNSQIPTGLAEALQACCLSRRNGQINFRSGESSGFIYLQHGRVIHAVCGAVEGEDAIYRMLSWPAGEFSLNEDILPQEKTVMLSWEQLLLEGARRMDQGVDSGTSGTVPVVTTAPSTTTRVRDNLPKITLTLPGERPRVYELEAEYTHVGRASGNEVPLSDPSVSNRHCIFVLNGPDVVLRDLNSSNGTLVNGQAISETVLRPGDLIQVGVVEMKFEPAIRRPKLTQAIGSSFGEGSELSQVLERAPSSRSTLKLPQATARTTKPEEVRDNSVFVKGESAISYENLPKPEDPAKTHSLLLLIGAVIILLALAGGGYYYFTTYPR